MPDHGRRLPQRPIRLQTRHAYRRHRRRGLCLPLPLAGGQRDSAGLYSGGSAGPALQGLIFGPFGAFTAELFPTPVRYRRITGQSASTFGAGFTPAIAAGLLVIGGGNLTLLGSVWILAFVAAAAAILLTKEGRTRDLAHTVGMVALVISWSL